MSVLKADIFFGFQLSYSYNSEIMAKQKKQNKTKTTTTKKKKQKYKFLSKMYVSFMSLLNKNVHNCLAKRIRTSGFLL